MRYCAVALLVALAVPLSPGGKLPVGKAVNFLVDRGFEDDDPIWSFNPRASRVSDEGTKKGNFAAKAELVAGLNGSVSQITTTNAVLDRIYFVSAHVKLVDPGVSLIVRLADEGNPIGAVRINDAGEVFLTRGIVGVDPEVQLKGTLDVSDFVFIQATGQSTGVGVLSLNMFTFLATESDAAWLIDEAWISDSPDFEGTPLSKVENTQTGALLGTIGNTQARVFTFQRSFEDRLSGSLVPESRLGIDPITGDNRDRNLIDDTDRDQWLDAFPPRPETEPGDPRSQ